MTKHLLILFGLFAFTLSNASAQPPGPPPQDGPGGPPPEGRRGGPPGQGGRGAFFRSPPGFLMMTALDADSDGKLSAKEIANAANALKALDKDDDGKLSGKEIGWPPDFAGRFGGQRREQRGRPGANRGGQNRGGPESNGERSRRSDRPDRPPLESD